MSEELKNITENVMERIHNGKIKMKPKIYFIIGSILTFFGLVFSIIISMLSIGLIRFSIRARGPMAEYRFEQMVSDFPWWIVILTILSLVVGIWLIQKYDFSYKIKSWVIVLVFVLVIVVAGLGIDMIGLNDTLVNRGPMKGMMHDYIKKPPPQMRNF